MVSIGIRELRRNASRYIRLVKAGERVAVTEHGEVVAYLVPAEEPNSILDRLEAAGQYRPAIGSILDVLPIPTPPPGGKPVSETVIEMRNEERW